MQTINYIFNSEDEKTGVFLNYDSLEKEKISDFEKKLRFLILNNYGKNEIDNSSAISFELFPFANKSKMDNSR